MENHSQLTVNYGFRYEVNSRIHEDDQAHLKPKICGRIVARTLLTGTGMRPKLILYQSAASV